MPSLYSASYILPHFIFHQKNEEKENQNDKIFFFCYITYEFMNINQIWFVEMRLKMAIGPPIVFFFMKTIFQRVSFTFILRPIFSILFPINLQALMYYSAICALCGCHAVRRNGTILREKNGDEDLMMRIKNMIFYSAPQAVRHTTENWDGRLNYVAALSAFCGHE